MAPRPVGSPYGTILSPCRQSAGAVRTGSLRTGKLCPRTGGLNIDQMYFARRKSVKNKVLGLLMAAVLCLCLLPVSAATDGDVTVKYDGVDEASGNIKRSGGGSRNGTVLTASDTDVTLSSGQFYIVQDNVTISDDLTVDGSQAGGLILCANATLTVNGALIHTGGTKFSIYGQTQPNTAARWSGSF